MHFSEEFKVGIDQVSEKLGIDNEAADQLVEFVCQATEDAIREAARLGDKVGGEPETALDLFIAKKASELEKYGVIKQQECTDSEGNKGSWVLYDSSGSKKLGCHSSRAAAEAQERAVQASKYGALSDPMESGGKERGRAGRKALANKYKSGNTFDMSRCMSEQKGNVDNPAAFCQSLKGLALGTYTEGE